MCGKPNGEDWDGQAQIQLLHQWISAAHVHLRAGDSIDTHASGNWFDRIMIKDLDKGRFTSPGAPDVPHAWAYLPDLAQAAVALAAQGKDLPRFTDLAFPVYTLSGADIAALLRKIIRREITVSQMNWVPLTLLQPTWPMARKMTEMRYLWDTPDALEGTALAMLLPEFKEAPAQDALAQAISHLGL